MKNPNEHFSNKIECCMSCELDIENGYCKRIIKLSENEREKIPEWCPYGGKNE